MSTQRCEQCGGRFDRPGLFHCTDGHPSPTTAQQIVAAVEDTIRSRRGLKGEWESINDDLQDDIRDEWTAKIEQILTTLEQRIAELERGEFICKRCGLRKDSEHEKADF